MFSLKIHEVHFEGKMWFRWSIIEEMFDHKVETRVEGRDLHPTLTECMDQAREITEFLRHQFRREA